MLLNNMTRRKNRGSKKSVVLGFLLIMVLIGGLVYSGTIKILIDASSVDNESPSNYIISDSTLEDKFETKSVLFFSSSWCGPCGTLSNQLKGLAAKYQNVQFFEVNIENNRNLANKYQAYLTPAVVLISNTTKPSVYQEVNSDDLDKVVSRFSLQ
jgi:thiol-disulfide isomerase/thioredoxin